jgi:uncharacterized membrane protein YfcA
MRWFKALLGGLLVLWCPVMLLAPRWPALVVGGRWGDGLAGMAGGVLGGVGGFTGVVPTLWCTLRRYPKELQRAVIQNFNLSMLLVTMAVYLGTGMVTREMLPLCAVVAPAMLLPTWLGTRLYIGISEARFRQLVLGLLTLSGWPCWRRQCRNCWQRPEPAGRGGQRDSRVGIPACRTMQNRDPKVPVGVRALRAAAAQRRA